MKRPEQEHAFVPWFYLHVWTQQGTAHTFIACKTSSPILQDSFKSLLVFHFSYEKNTLSKQFLACLWCGRLTKRYLKGKSSCNVCMSAVLQQVWKKCNVIYYNLFSSATIALQKLKENNVIEHTCLLCCRNLKQPQARANTDVVQGIKRVLDAVASNYPGI